MAFSANLSVVTYTYNDGALARGLLQSLAGQEVAPREIVVVDDGSAEPFAPPPIAVPVRLVRLEPNQGATRAKQAGLDAAGSKFLLSIDADVRLGPGWLAAAMPLAADPKVGMVGSAIRYDAGDGPLARYLALVYGFHPTSGEVDCIPGPVWLMRRETWQRLGGFAGHPDPIGEDSFLCGRLRQVGLKLVVARDIEARQVRRLTRAAAAGRGFTWQGSHLRRALARGASLAEVTGALLRSASKRLPELVRIDPDLAYFELLYLSHGLLELTSAATPTMVTVLRAAIDRFAAPYPGLARLLTADLTKLGHAQPPAESPTGPSPAPIATLAELISPTTLQAIEDHGLDALAQTDAEADFSFYLT